MKSSRDRRPDGARITEKTDGGHTANRREQALSHRFVFEMGLIRKIRVQCSMLESLDKVGEADRDLI